MEFKRLRGFGSIRGGVPMPIASKGAIREGA